MEKKIYWRNVINGPFYKNLEPGMFNMSIFAHNNEYKNGTTFAYHCVKDVYQAMEPHSHPNLEIFVFLGSDPQDIDNLHGGEITICLGDEQEEYKITEAGVAMMPAGLMHCPLIIKPGDKPIVWIEISETAGYSGTQDDDFPDVLLNPPEPPAAI